MIVRADQDDRKDFFKITPNEILDLYKQDEQRRRRVGEIFGEGCFSKAEEFAGQPLSTNMAMSQIIFYKRLCGLKEPKSWEMKSATCWCLEKVEPSFPDHIRKDFAGKTLNEASDWLDELNQGLNCPKVECPKDLKASPKGTIPGFW